MSAGAACGAQGEHRDHPGSIVNVSGAGVDQTTNGIALAFLAIECL